MNGVASKFDPWGPISTVLYETGDSDFVQNAIANTGVRIQWHPQNKSEKYSHGTRIRAFRQDIADAYGHLDDQGKAAFAQIVVKAMLARHDSEELRLKLLDRLSDIGWTISDDGVLRTEDPLVSEQFFPPNSEYDAYTTIRDIIATARTDLLVVDAYIGSSLLVTLRSSPVQNLNIRLLAAEHNLKPDFRIEVAAFQRQFPRIRIEVRASSEFHDRFIVVDNAEIYHVGASIKDAGKRAFMISRIEDSPNVESIKTLVERAWSSGKVLHAP